MLRVTTASGSTYHFDNEALTWRRENQNRPDILFMEGVHEGKLAAPVEPVVGQRLTFFLPGDDWVVTTPVASVEQV
jgi:hypothetical protein